MLARWVEAWPFGGQAKCEPVGPLDMFFPLFVSPSSLLFLFLSPFYFVVSLFPVVLVSFFIFFLICSLYFLLSSLSPFPPPLSPSMLLLPCHSSPLFSHHPFLCMPCCILHCNAILQCTTIAAHACTATLCCVVCVAFMWGGEECCAVVCCGMLWYAVVCNVELSVEIPDVAEHVFVCWCASIVLSCLVCARWFLCGCYVVVYCCVV